MNLNLPSDLNHVTQQLSSGNYSSTEELIGEALRLLRELRQKQTELLADVHVGLEQSERGLGEPLDLDALLECWSAKLAEEGIPD